MMKNKLTPDQIDSLSEYMAEDILNNGGDIGPLLAHYFYLMISGQAPDRPFDQKMIKRCWKQSGLGE
jgi:hypothetical protein